MFVVLQNQIENHINKSDDFKQSIGVAVRVDKFSDSSIDMYVRCFTKTNSWNDWLSVKERLAIEIKLRLTLIVVKIMTQKLA